MRWILLKELHEFSDELAQVVVQCPRLQLGVTFRLDGAVCFVNGTVRQFCRVGALIGRQ